jgi:hypothetical protein
MTPVRPRTDPYPCSVAGPRSSSIRGTRVPGTSPIPPAPQPSSPEPVADPRRPRDVVSYALARSAALRTVFRGFGSEHCDADPYLVRAAKFHGEPTQRTCGVCRRTELINVTYTYGDELGPYSGRVRSTAELASLAISFGSFRVYVVEVCLGCGWNHLTLSYVLGDGVPRRPLGRPRDLLE